MAHTTRFTTLVIATALLTFATTGSAGHHSGKGGMKGQKVFANFDANKDGALSIEEFTQYTTAKFGKMDANNDGALTLDEYSSHHEMKQKRRQKKKEMRDSMRDAVDSDR